MAQFRLDEQQNRVVSPIITLAVEGRVASGDDMVQCALSVLTQLTPCGLDVSPEPEKVRCFDPVHSRVEEELDQLGTRAVDQVVPG